MVYMGSKNRISKELAPIIQSYIDNMPDCKGYLEPFVGGANMIDKIHHKNRIGCDINKYLIALLKYARDTPEKLPKTITEEQYKKVKNNKDNYPDYVVGCVGFCATFGAKFFNGYGRDSKGGKTISNERLKNIQVQSKNLKGIKFKCLDYRKIPKSIKNYVIYCDPPYNNTAKYNNSIDYEEFYDWCWEMSVNNIVLISEYNMQEEFRCIWQKESKVNFASQRNENTDKKRIEKLFII